ncbi:F-box domain-containing protein [Dioscorea alata]|uniref:F-box domain-containing protein n=1 Tax=Dioscorea alata TaxID=55571 RepID=A0ACB7UEA6_DIOAL|nr:F-box domain-containing protein [Dioscorea alata]
MADYANLPKDTLQEITKFLSFSDYIKFGAVCSQWYDMAKERHQFFQKQLPWLLFFDNNSPKLFDPSEEKVYQIEIPELQGRRCVSSSHGWLITIDLNVNLNLLNPLSKAQVKLPKLPFDTSNDRSRNHNECFWLATPEERRDQFVYKAVLSTDPCKGNDYIVMVIYYAHFKLAFWRPGDLTWTMINSDFYLEDIIWCSGAFYVVGSSNQVCLVELGMDNKLIKISSQDTFYFQGLEKYLVDFMGDLILVFKDYFYNNENGTEDDSNEGNYDNGYRTGNFILFKLDRKDKKFIELKDINGYILILGSNQAVLIPTIDLVDKTKDNLIFFSDDFMHGSHKYGYIDSGAYNIRDKRITLFPLSKIYNLTKKPIFIDVNHVTLY